MWEEVKPAPPPISPEREAIIAQLSDYPRLEEQSYLTLPEWYIVYSADEYAAFITKNRPSQFPYFQAIGQYWGSYYGMCAVTRGRSPFNSGYHLALAVIGTSFTVENLLKGVYENSIGWLTEAQVSDLSKSRHVDTPVSYGDSTRLTAATGWLPAIPFEQTLLDMLTEARERCRNGRQSPG